MSLVVTKSSILSGELIDMLTKAVEAYGNNEVYAVIKNEKYVINDLKIAIKGNVFILVLDKGESKV